MKAKSRHRAQAMVKLGYLSLLALVVAAEVAALYAANQAVQGILAVGIPFLVTLIAMLVVARLDPDKRVQHRTIFISAVQLSGAVAVALMGIWALQVGWRDGGTLIALGTILVLAGALASILTGRRYAQL